MFGGMTTYRARPGDGQKDDATLFREMLEIVFKAPEWLHWNQAPGEGIEFTVPRFRIKGLLRIEKGEREWWPYPVDRQRLRTEGPDAMARDFLEGYEQARKP
jgi:hypothetical protein